jgi:hypothetical protein
MPNFAAIAHLDTFEIAGSLRTRWGLFKPTGTPGLRTLRVRGVKTGTEGGPEEFVRYKPAASWVELGNLRAEIARRAEAILPPGIEFGCIYLEMLDAGARLDWIAEDDSYFTRWSRAILPLRTNPGVLLIYGNETASPGPGWLTIVSPRLPHAAINMGVSTVAVWLTIDFRRKPDA